MGWQDAPLVDTPKAKGGWQDAPLVAPEPVAKGAPTVAEDVANTIPSTIARAPFMIAGAPADMLGFGMQAGRWIDENVLGNPVKSAEDVAAANPLANYTSAALEKAYTDAAGAEPYYEPQTKTGQIVDATLRPAVAAGLTAGLGGGPRVVPRAAVTGGAAGAGGEIARQKTEGTKAELPAQLAATLLGGFAGDAAVTGARRIVTPRNIPAENAAAARVLRQEGIGNLTEGQITQSKRVLAAERQRLGHSGDARRVEQMEGLTRAALRRVGVDANRATPDVIDQAFNDIGQQYAGLAARNTLVPDRNLANDLRSTVRYYTDRVAAPNRIPLIGGYLQEMSQLLQQNGGRAISGEAYQSLRSRIQADARGMSDPTAKRTLFDMAEALDDAMERSIRQSNPDDLGGFRDARRRYRNMLVIEDATTVAGSDAALGLISPAALRSATKRLQGKRNMARGRGDFEELSRAASGIMTELPLTGTAPLINPRGLFDAGLMTPFDWVARGISAARMTAPVQRYLTNRLLPPPQTPPIRRSLLPTVPAIQQQIPGSAPIIPPGAFIPPGSPDQREQMARILAEQ